MGITRHYNLSRRVSPFSLWTQIRPQDIVEKIPHLVIFGEKNLPLRSLAARRLRLHHPRGQNKYISKLRQINRHGNILKIIQN